MYLRCLDESILKMSIIMSIIIVCICYVFYDFISNDFFYNSKGFIPYTFRNVSIPEIYFIGHLISIAQQLNYFIET